MGLGITDLEKSVAQSHDRGLAFEGAGGAMARLIDAAPQWVAFNGVTAGRVAARALNIRGRITVGEQPWSVGSSRVYVLPSSSGASARTSYPDKLASWARLQALIR